MFKKKIFEECNCTDSKVGPKIPIVDLKLEVAAKLKVAYYSFSETQ